jgi:vacuolar protein sorting-associated protein 13A/C
VATGQDLYFEILELQPIKLSLSFVRTERVSSDDKWAILNPFRGLSDGVVQAEHS